MHGVAVAVWVFGVRLVCRCVEKRGYCVGKTLGVWGRDYCAGAYPGFQRGGGVVPTLCFNRYMSWEGGGIAVRLWVYTKSGGGGQGWRHFICHGRGSRCPPPPPPKAGADRQQGWPLQYEPCDSPNASEKWVFLSTYIIKFNL